MSLRIGFIGLGGLGTPIANNLAASLKSPLVVFNRTAAKYQDLAEPSHYQVAESVEKVAEDADVVFTCLINDEACVDIYSKLFAGAKALGKKVIGADHSTVLPATAAKLEALAKEHGCVYLGCPLWGTPPVAKAAQLLLVVSGDPESKKIVSDILKPAVGKAIIDAGDEASKGVTLKLVGNSTIFGTIELLAETYTLADKIGLDASVVHSFVDQWHHSPSWMNYSHRISTGTFDSSAGFPLYGAMKDVRHILSLDPDFKMPTMERVLVNMEKGVELGGDKMDGSSIAAVMRQENGLEPFKEGSDGGKSKPL
ncbi:hypothetical protein P7C73_g2285, partial [Tremellales sp. Uapishka_1]